MWPQPIDAAQDLGEQRPRHRHLGQLEDGVATVPDDPGANLDQLLAQRGQRPMFDLLGQDQGAQEVGEVVSQGVELEADRVVTEGVAGQPRPPQRQLALFDVLAGRGRRSVGAFASDNGAHRQIMGEPLGVVDVFVTGEPTIDRLPQQTEEPVANVLPAPAFAQSLGGHRGQAEGIIQLRIGQQTAVGGDPRTMELKLDPAVGGDPKRLARFTRRVRHSRPAPSALSL